MQAIFSPSQVNPGAPEPSPLAADLYALIVHLNKNCNSDLFEVFGTLELSLTQMKLLYFLQDADHDLTLKEAAKRVHVSLPAASRMVDDLVRRGFVQRAEDVEDRRMKRVSLTEPGRTVISRLDVARLSGLERFVQTLGEDERAALAGALSKLLEREEIAASRLEGAPR